MNIANRYILNALLDYVASQIGSLSNPTNISNALTSVRHENINSKMISDYLGYTMDAFLISLARRYDVKEKTYFNYPNKYYYTDIGLRNARLNYRQYDPGHIMENIIYNELVKRGYSVDVGQVTERKGNEKISQEIDFVVNDGDRRIYVYFDGGAVNGIEWQANALTRGGNTSYPPRDPPSRSSCRRRQWLQGNYPNRSRGSELKGYRLRPLIFCSNVRKSIDRADAFRVSYEALTGKHL